MNLTTSRVRAAYRIALNWRLHKRLPRLAALAKTLGFDKEVAQ